MFFVTLFFHFPHLFPKRTLSAFQSVTQQLIKTENMPTTIFRNRVRLLRLRWMYSTGFR